MKRSVGRTLGAAGDLEARSKESQGVAGVDASGLWRHWSVGGATKAMQGDLRPGWRGSLCVTQRQGLHTACNVVVRQSCTHECARTQKHTRLMRTCVSA